MFNIIPARALFALTKDTLDKVREISFGSERAIQRVTEHNLDTVFGLEFVKTEVTLGNLRIDTLAFDKTTQSFVIIEYKKGKNFSVIDQGYAYLALLLNHKADFILEYNESKDTNLRRGDIDWSQSRVVFVAPQFTKYQKQAINFRDLPIELWEITRYRNNVILYNQLQSPEMSESITTVSPKSDLVQKVSREIKVYTEEDHTQGMPERIVETYAALKDRVLNLGENIQVRPRKHYVGFIANTNFTDIHLMKSKLKLWINLNAGELDDPQHMARDVSQIGHWGNGDYEVNLKLGTELDYLMTLIMQAYTKHTN
jgi:predicted transport protein